MKHKHLIQGEVQEEPQNNLDHTHTRMNATATAQNEPCRGAAPERDHNSSLVLLPARLFHSVPPPPPKACSVLKRRRGKQCGAKSLRP